MAEDDFPRAVHPHRHGVAQPAADEHDAIAPRKSQTIPTIEPSARIQAPVPGERRHLAAVKVARKDEVVLARAISRE